MTGRIRVTAEIVGIGSDGTEPSVVFAVHRCGVYSADQTLLKRYLFNCGEGTQRLCGENGIKLNSLDSIFLTRLDVRSASGIPGLVFALGGLGAAHLRVHGPMGTRDRLRAMESFVRRKYPKIECAEVAPPGGVASDSETDRSEIPRHYWATGSPQEDAYARIIAVPLAEELNEVPACWICAKCTPLQEKRPVVTRPVLHSVCGTDLVDDDPDRRWLRRFYEAKGLNEKIPHMDAILRRYSGRMEELKAQLVNKYGTAEESDSSSSSSSSSESEQEDIEKEEEVSQKAFDASAPLDRAWLAAFYQKHEPAKVLRVDQILRQFAGREDQLKEMLLSKYSETNQHNDPPSPPAKKQKIGVDDEKTDVANAPQSLVPELYVEDGTVRTDPPSSSPQPSSESLCYILQFRSPPYPVVWVVDCQATQYIDSLATRFAPSGGCEHRPVIIVHFSSPAVLTHPKYQAWIHTVNGASETATEHVVFDGHALRAAVGGVFSFAFVASARNYLKNQASGSLPTSSRWAKLQHLLTPGSPLDADRPPLQLRLRRRYSELSLSTTIAQAMLKYSLQDTVVEDYSHTGWKYIASKESVDEENLQASPVPAHQPCHDLAARQLSILGTGSAAPSKLRASTSMYLSLSSVLVDGGLPGMLIDCGEGTFGQLQRQFDTEEALAARLAGLKCIWISHHHADHQCGLLRVLDEYVRVTQQFAENHTSLFVIAPQGVLAYVRAWLPTLPPRVCLRTCADMNDTPRLKLHLRDYIIDMRSVRVWHCHDAFGLILRLRDGTKLVYSGDTKPCEQLVRAGMDATLLIHQATFDDSMEDDADKKKHSTVGQAIDVARRMRAKRVVLTHFSQRYPALPPPMSSSAEGSGSATDAHAPLEIFCAYDGFTIAV